jgi:predicted unusual protein kinase regulating ubiquinone biosynthesis (AarF/ABC1/UbiB family)
VIGQKLNQVLEAEDSHRTFLAETLWRFVFKSLFHGLFNADPHPGNYLFGQDHVWFLDFGCSRRLSDARVEMIRQMHAAAIAQDEAGFLKVGGEFLGLLNHGEQARRAREYFRLCFEPLFAPGPYRITREYCRRLLKDMQDNAKEMVFGSRRDHVPLPADLLFLNRLQLGFYSVLAQLDVAVDYRRVDAGLIAECKAAG